MKKYKRWNKESSVIYLKKGGREEMIKAFTKYNMPYKQRIRDLESAIVSGEAVVK
jgi:hypothetical protein